MNELSPPEHLRNQLSELPDGRNISFAEFGDPLGYPVIYFHGFPGCRLEAWTHHRQLQRNRIRLICPDRPGIGGSSFQPGRTYLDHPHDVLHLADHLGLQKFGILGASGGGPYAVACARIIPAERMSAVGLLAPASPEHIAGQEEGAGKDLKVVSRIGLWAVRRVPSAVESLVGVVVSVIRWLVTKQWVIDRMDRWFERSNRSKPHREAIDVEDLDEPLSGREQRQQLLAVFNEEFKQGTRAAMEEANLLLQPWGYDLSEVTYDPVQVWHGSKNVNAPIQQSRLMARRIPHAVMKEYELDHPGMLERLGMVLDELVTDKMRQDV